VVKKTKIHFDFQHFYINYLPLFDKSNSCQTFSLITRKFKITFPCSQEGNNMTPNSQLLSVEGYMSKVNSLCKAASPYKLWTVP